MCIRDSLISIEKLPLFNVPAVGIVIRSVGGGYSCPNKSDNKIVTDINLFFIVFDEYVLDKLTHPYEMSKTVPYVEVL